MAAYRPVIRKWKVSYYVESCRKWVYGDLSVIVDYIYFQEANNGETNVTLYFSELTGVQKTTTALIFSSVTVTLRDGGKHWFSSLPDRSSIFNLILHFWKCRLTQKDTRRQSRIANSEKTRLGRKLLSIVDDSEQTLEGAAMTLHEQGEQLNVSLATMCDVHDDLDVANHIIAGFESWLGRWHLPNHYQTVDFVLISDDDIPEICEYEVLYTKLEVAKCNSQNLGVMRIDKIGLIILTLNQKKVHLFKWKDISRLKVLTPWEMIATRYLIGQPDLSFAIVCTNLVEIIRLLQKPLGSKVEFDVPPNFDKQTSGSFNEINVACLSNANVSTLSRKLENIPEQKPAIQLHLEGQSQTQMQMQKSKVISDCEVHELRSALSGLKCLALSIQEEQDVQNEKIDSLTSSVDTANTRVTDLHKRIDHLA